MSGGQIGTPSGPGAKGAGDGWKRVVFSAECDEDGNCPHCAIDYTECECPGPTMDGMEYRFDDKGVMWARPEAR